jgi:nucleoside-diphosphate-sugar epimerase
LNRSNHYETTEEKLSGAILVTGGAGFIGAYVTCKLLEEGYRVLVYDQQPQQNALDLILPKKIRNQAKLRVEDGEITDGWRLIELCKPEQVEGIIHLASPLTAATVRNPAMGIRDICLGTSTMFSVAKVIGAHRIIWASSIAVFGSKSQYATNVLGDDAVHRPPNIYGSCKSLCENLALQAHDLDGLDVVGLRLSIVYGAGRLRGYMSYPSHLMREAASGTAVHIKYGRQSLHWQYVGEVADMIHVALTSGRTGNGKTYNAFGDTRSWRDAATIIKSERPGLHVTIDDDLDPTLEDVVDNFSANGFSADYNYDLRWPLELGIAETLATYDRIRQHETNEVSLAK